MHVRVCVCLFQVCPAEDMKAVERKVVSYLNCLVSRFALAWWLYVHTQRMKHTLYTVCSCTPLITESILNEAYLLYVLSGWLSASFPHASMYCHVCVCVCVRVCACVLHAEWQG